MNKSIEYILSQLCKPLYSSELNSIYALMDMMNNEELKSAQDILIDIYNQTYDKSDTDNLCNDGYDSIAPNEYNDEIIECILDYIQTTLKSRNLSPNRSITELLELLSKSDENRLSIVAELCERFEYQSFDDQKRIIRSLLRYDHDYISHTIINDYWGKILINDIVEMWERCENVSYNKYIIQSASEEFVLDNINKLSASKYDYIYLCRRLGNHPDFNIDQSKLYNKFTYYSVLKSLGRDIDKEKILRELFSYIRDWIVAPSAKLEIIEHQLSISYPSEFYISSKLIPIVRDAIWSFSHMKLNEELLYFYEWDSDIRKKVDAILKKRYADRMYNPTIEEMWLLYCKLARKYFPEKFITILCEDSRHKKRRKEMIDELKPFIEQFGFEVEDDEEDFGVYNNESQSPSNDYIISKSSLDEVPF